MAAAWGVYEMFGLEVVLTGLGLTDIMAKGSKSRLIGVDPAILRPEILGETP